MNTSFQTRNKKSAVVSVTSDRDARGLPTAGSPPDEGEDSPPPDGVEPVDTISSEDTEVETRRALQEDVKAITTGVTIWKTLGETEKRPRLLVHRIINKLGADSALTILEETQAIEASGGMLLPDLSRRRTPGGVFFFLVKQRHPDLFPMWTARREADAKRKDEKAEHAAAPPSQKSITQPPLVPQKGLTVKITLVGRPTSRIDDRGTYVAFVMQSNKVPTLPKGLPAPDEVKTNYVVHIASKQWRKVAAALTDPEDFLVIEGFPQLNSQNNSIIVFATNVTTKNLQRAAKEAQREQVENKEQQ